MRMSGTRLVSRTERLTAIEQLLFHSSIGLRVVDIAEACGVDRRTIYRDLTMLADVGIPIEQKDGRFYINRDHYTATTRLTFDEAMALFMAARIAARFQEQHNPHTLSALQKIGSAFPRSIEAHVGKIVENQSEMTVDLRYLSVLETLSRAWSERRKVRLWCGGGHDPKPKARDFAPYFIEPNEAGVLCAVGFDSLMQRVRVFTLNRVLRARLTTVPYKIPDQFDVGRYLLGGWNNLTQESDAQVEVILLFTPDAAELLREGQGPPYHRLDRLDDDSLKLTLYVNDWQELLPWIRSWGAQVEVLEPAVLRQQCAQEAARLEARYRPVARAR